MLENGLHPLWFATFGAVLALVIRCSGWTPDPSKPMFEFLHPDNSTLYVCSMSALIFFVLGLYTNSLILYEKIQRYLIFGRR